MKKTSNNQINQNNTNKTNKNHSIKRKKKQKKKIKDIIDGILWNGIKINYQVISMGSIWDF